MPRPNLLPLGFCGRKKPTMNGLFWCGHCLQWKKKSDFSTKSNVPVGIASECRVCEKERGIEYKIRKKGQLIRQGMELAAKAVEESGKSSADIIRVAIKIHLEKEQC